jgi:putative peptidoglycan lipid II flippase
MAGLIALREPIVNLLFQRGLFDYAATQGTAEALLFYSLGIWSVVGVRVVTVAFYSMQDTRTPVKIATVGMLTNILCSFLLMGPMKHSGLALAYAVASWVNFSLLFFFLRKKLGRVDARKIFGSFFKTFLSSVAMGLVGWGLLRGQIWQQSGNSPVKAAYMTGTVILCVGVYMACSYFLKNEEMGYVYDMMKKKFGGKKEGI